MADLQPVQGQVQFTGDTTAVDQATSSLDNFGNSLKNIGSIAAGLGLYSLVNDITSIGEGAVQAISQFQNATVAIGTVLDNIGNSSDNTVQAMAGNGQKMADIAQEQADALITYNEKVSKIQDEIATVMQGQNVIDAQSSMYEQLDSLAEEHASRIESLQDQITSIQTSETNNLSDMQGSHDVKMQDMAEKHAQEMADATSDIQRAALQKKYDQEVQYENDSFQRQYDLKKSELDRDSAQKIASVQDEIDKENTAYQEKYDKEKATDEKRIADLEAQNAKKLADYKQQLADEERLYDEHVHKLQESAAKAGSAVSNSFTQPLAANSPFAAQKESLQQFMDFVNQFSQNTPFNFADITEYGRMVETMGYNFQNLAPIISNIAAGTGKTFGVTTQAMMDAVNGRMTMLQMELGINKEELIQYGAEFDKQGHLINQSSLFDAFKKLSETKFSGATEKELHTLGGAFSDVQDAIFKTEASFLGMDTATAHSGGLFKALTDAMLGFANFLNTHQKDISSFVTNMTPFLEVIGVLSGMIMILMIPAMLLWAGTMATTLVNSMIAFITTGWSSIPMLLGMSGAGDALSVSLLGLDIPIIAVILGIGALILIGVELISHWSSLEKAGVQAWNTLGNAARTIIKDIIDWINKLIEGVDKMTHGIINIPKIDYGTGGALLGTLVGGPLGGLIGANLGNSQNSTDTWNVANQGWSASPLDGAIGNILSSIMSIGGKSGTAGGSLSGLTGGLQSIQQQAAGGPAPVIVNNQNTFNTPYDPTNFAKQLGIQIQLQH